MSTQLQSLRRGVTLRHWTAGNSSQGVQQRPSPALEYWDLARRRRRDLVASMLKLITKPVAAEK